MMAQAIVRGAPPYVCRSCPLDLRCVGAGKAGHKGKQALPLLVICMVVEVHSQTADRAGEALRHLPDIANRPVVEASCDRSGLIDEVPPSGPGKAWDPRLTLQFSRWSKSPIVSTPVEPRYLSEPCGTSFSMVTIPDERLHEGGSEQRAEHCPCKRSKHANTSVIPDQALCCLSLPLTVSPLK